MQPGGKSGGRRVALALTGALVVAGALSGVMADSATAEDGPVAWSNGAGGASWWVAEGDHHVVQDLAKDGHSAVGRLYVPYRNKVYNNWVTGGLNHRADFNFNLAEDSVLSYQTCVGEAGTGAFSACGPWVYGKA
ncbi:hypothetical protein ACFYVL_23145 [Streptomyces sp. NPDC004111]|uniref:hypothetical protein n=1 Tax=Streptomyces sp. NPDC004111 TaxID=3364690 RepID=UPI00368128E4